LFGEIELRTYGKGGVPITVTVALFPWEYSKSAHRLSAQLLPLQSVTEKNPHGTPIGKLSLVVPHGLREWSDAEARSKGEKAVGELKQCTGQLTVNGHGPYAVEFKRESDNAPPSPTMRKAKQVGKRK
jgi:hypothetical protein